MNAERTIDSMARECEARRALRPLRTFSDLEHEHEERNPNPPRHEQLSLLTEAR